MNKIDLQNRDAKHLWHPLTQHKTYPSPLIIESAKGAMLKDSDGNSYIDGISSWYTCTYGHSNEYIIGRVKEQLDQLDHVVFTGFTHKPAIELSEKLMEILPANQEKIFFSDSGSSSVDVALKMAFQYHYNKGERKNTILAFEDGFHGDTFGAMSVSSLSIYNGPFEPFFLDVIRIPVPTLDTVHEIIRDVEKLSVKHSISSFIYEPLVQGAAAMKMHDAESLGVLLQKIKQLGILCIADEVMTGFGKTGTHFASDQVAPLPDIMCLAKSLTGGIAPMALTTCSADIYDAFFDDSIYKGFFHGHTYSANPLGCTAAAASISLLQSTEIQDGIQSIIRLHEDFAKVVSQHEGVEYVTQKGIILSIGLNANTDRYGDLRNRLYDFFMKKGVYLRPLGNVIYILPPFIISEDELKKIYTTIIEALNSL